MTARTKRIRQGTMSFHVCLSVCLLILYHFDDLYTIQILAWTSDEKIFAFIYLRLERTHLRQREDCHRKDRKRVNQQMEIDAERQIRSICLKNPISTCGERCSINLSRSDRMFAS
jgi:hypothetical protein